MKRQTLLIVCLAYTALAHPCSPVPPTLVTDPTGLVIRKHNPNDFALLAEVLGTVHSANSSRAGEFVSSLRVRVIESATARARPGQELELSAYMVGGSACEHSWGKPISLHEYPVGSRVRVSSDSLSFPSWEMHRRLVRVP